MAQAGKLGAVTVATNMAGRGTDIMLGGNAEYMATERPGARPVTPTRSSPTPPAMPKPTTSEILEARQLFAEQTAPA